MSKHKPKDPAAYERKLQSAALYHLRWDDDDVAALLRLRAEGRTTREIAVVLERTQQGVLSKIHNMRARGEWPAEGGVAA